MKGTLGGSAWATAKERLGLEDSTWKNSAEYNAARAGYFGGRVTVGRIKAESGFRFDINSAYPAALSNLQLPCGDRIRVAGKLAARHYKAGSAGVYRCSVFVPRNCHLPPLPIRTPKNRVCYPVGRFIGDWAGIELERAERYGATIEKIWAGIVWKETIPVFKEFMRDVFDVRSKVGKKTPLGKWQKLFGNSLTGKFAQSPENERVVVNPDMAKRILCSGGDCGGNADNCMRRRGRCCDHHCSKRCRAWKQIDIKGRIWSMPFWSLPDCGNVHWAAYLTAWTRGVWLEFARQFGEHFVYGDTDSVYASREPYDKRNIGDSLGMWSSDGAMLDFEAIGPKAYRYREPDGKWFNRLKGVPSVKDEQWEQFKQGLQIVNSRGVMGFRSAAKRSENLFTRKLIKRSDLSDGVWFGDRKLLPNSVVTKPVTYAEQLNHERE